MEKEAEVGVKGRRRSEAEAPVGMLESPHDWSVCEIFKPPRTWSVRISRVAIGKKFELGRTKQQMENQENMESAERVRLRELEATGSFVFHGSGWKNEILEPRQAHNYPSNRAEGKIPDDKPAVFASPKADIAIFMAIINKANFRNLRSGFSTLDNGEMEFRATPETMIQLHNAKGYVYVFDKNQFTMRSGVEGLSYEPVEPIEIVEVTEKDLPKDIVVKDF